MTLKKWANIMKKLFIREYSVADRHKKVSYSLVIRKQTNKTSELP